MDRLLVVNPWDKQIGPNRYLADLLRQDGDLAARTVVVVPEEGEAAQEYRELGCSVEIWREARLVHLSFAPRNLARLLAIHTLGVIRAARRMRALGISVALTNSENVWFGGIASRLARIPHLQVFHALSLEHHWGGRPRLVRLYLGWLELWSRRFVAVSGAVRQMLSRNGIHPERIALVPNGIDARRVTQDSERPLPPEIEALCGSHHPVLVSLGRISPIKGQDLLVEALGQLSGSFPDLVCVAGGAVLSNDGVEDTEAFFQAVKRQVRDRGLSERVLFLGQVDFAPALIRRADVYVQSSRSESFCRAVAEAMAIGTPVAAFRVGGIPELTGEKGAALAAPEDPGALAEAIRGILDDPANRATLIACGREGVSRFQAGESAAALRRAVFGDEG